MSVASSPLYTTLTTCTNKIISSRPKARRGGARRGSARAQLLGTGPIVSPAARARARARGRAGVAPPVVVSQPQSTPADKIIVSNLPSDVNEAQIKVNIFILSLHLVLADDGFASKDLFHSTVGPLRQVTLHFDSAGRSKGVAAIQFQRQGDGTKAYTQYNNRLIDGS